MKTKRKLKRKTNWKTTTKTKKLNQNENHTGNNGSTVANRSVFTYVGQTSSRCGRSRAA